MAEADFSWNKILSFFGVAILAFIGIVNLGLCGLLLSEGRVFYAIFAMLGGFCAWAIAVALYKRYENRDKSHKD